MDQHAQDCLDFARVCELLAGYACTSLGRELARRIRPIPRHESVQRWLRQVEELQRLAAQRGLPPLGGITDVRDIVKRCAPPLRVSVEDMARVGETLAGTHAVAEYFRDLPEEFGELRDVARRIGDFQTIAQRIRAVIDERGEVRDDASAKLSRLRREIEQATRDIGGTVERLLRDPHVRKLLQYANPTFHNDRVVLPVRTEYRGRLPGIIHRTSDSGATIYVEPAQAVELNNRISSLRVEEQEEINRLLWELAHEVHLNAGPIAETLGTLAVVDLLVAKVRFAHDFQARCPALDGDGRLHVRQARHPLLIDLQRRRAAAGEPPFEVVPIDYRLGDDFDLLMITGPNTGGKTVTLKTIGLINLMVQAGLPVPVGAGSTVGQFHEVLIDVGDEQSMQQSLSTFSAHLTRLLDMLKRAGRRTLVLIDELGAGTDPDEGAAIGQALLDELLRREARCVVTTHLGALKGFALTRERAENACVEFDTQTLRPTFHLRIGESGMSNAIDVATRLGMPARLVQAARRNLSSQAKALRAALRQTARVKRQAEQARAVAETARLQADHAQDQAAAARAQLEQQQAEFQEWVRRVVHLRPGDPVRVRNFDRDGRIVRVRLDQQRAEVDIGAFAVEVPLGDVLPPQTPAPPPPPPLPVVPRVIVAARVSPGTETKPRPPAAPRPPRRDERRPPRPPRGPAPGAPPSATPLPRTTPPPAAAPPKPRREDRSPPPMLDPLTDDQLNALQPGDQVYVKRFHREGTVARVNAAKRIVVMSVGLLEVEVPYGGLARVRPRPAPQPSPPHPVQVAPAPPAAAEQPLCAPAATEGPPPAPADAPASPASVAPGSSSYPPASPFPPAAPGSTHTGVAPPAPPA